MPSVSSNVISPVGRVRAVRPTSESEKRSLGAEVGRSVSTISSFSSFRSRVRHAYGLPGNIEAISDPSDEYDLTCSGTRHRHVPIFKMHGSCNWVYRSVNAYPSAQVARGNRTLVLWHNTKVSQSTTMRHSGVGRSSWYIWPLIVPPVYEKHRYITGELKRVWDDASDALREATRVIFWGYSFPKADLHARYFFGAAAHANDALRSPTLINPDAHAEDELWDVLRPHQVAHYRDVTAFLEHAD